MKFEQSKVLKGYIFTFKSNNNFYFSFTLQKLFQLNFEIIDFIFCQNNPFYVPFTSHQSVKEKITKILKEVKKNEIEKR